MRSSSPAIRIAEGWTTHVDPKTRLDRLRFRRRVNARRIPGLERLGRKETGWVVPADRIDAAWNCYTVGVGEESSFDVALAELGCRVVAIDPTPRAAVHIASAIERYDNIRMLPYAVWTEDGELRFFEPARPEYVSYSINNLHGTDGYITVPARTLSSIARELGDERVDLVKMDIEGAEFEVVAGTDFRALGTSVLCIEYHNRDGIDSMVESVRSLRRQGFVPVHTELTDVTLVRDSLVGGHGRREPR